MEPNKVSVDANLLVEELKSQRNFFADQLAVAGARLVKVTQELTEANALIDTLKNKE